MIVVVAVVVEVEVLAVISFLTPLSPPYRIPGSRMQIGKKRLGLCCLSLSDFLVLRFRVVVLVVVVL